MEVKVVIQHDLALINVGDKCIGHLPLFYNFEYNFVTVMASRCLEMNPEETYGLTDLILNEEWDVIRLLLQTVVKYIEQCLSGTTVIEIDHTHIDLNSIIEQLDASLDVSITSKAKKIHDYGVAMFLKDGSFNSYVMDESSFIILRKSILDYAMERFVSSINKALFDGEEERIRLYFERSFVMEMTLMNESYYEMNIKVICEDETIVNHHILLRWKDFKHHKMFEKLKTLKYHERIYVDDLIENIDIKYNVSMISPFSFGKSTLINAICKTHVLKTDVRAETSTITRLVDNDFKKITVKTSSGFMLSEKYSKSEDVIKILNATKAYDLNEIKITMPMKHLKDVAFIDVPGLYSRHDDHNRLTEVAIEMSDLVIFVIDPIQIGEKYFTQKIKKIVDSMHSRRRDYCFVLSKRDLYDEDEAKLFEELNTVLDSIRVKAPIFFVSAYFAVKGENLKSGLSSLSDIQKDETLYIIEDEFPFTGKDLQQHHADDLRNFSKVDELVSFINTKKEQLYG